MLFSMLCGQSGEEEGYAMIFSKRLEVNSTLWLQTAASSLSLQPQEFLTAAFGNTPLLIPVWKPLLL